MAKTNATKKTSATTELVLGQAAQNITKAVSELNTATESVNKLGALGEELTLLVANKEAEIEALDVQFAEKSRQAQVDLELSMKANTERVVTEYLRSTNKVVIGATELDTIKKELESTKNGAESETKRQVAIVSSSLKSQYENEMKLIQEQNKTAAAENASKIGVLVEKNAFLEANIAKMYQQMDAERAASIERAKAGSVGSINVSSERK